MAGKKNKTTEYRKGQEIKVRIIDIGMRGEGIGKLEDGYTVFIKDAVIGDYVRASIMKANKSYAYAHLEQILQASPHRVEPLCPVARQCGGCQLQAMSYEQELVYKQNKVRADLVRIGGFSEEEIDAVMEPIVGMQDNPTGPWRYRNKAQVPVGKNSAGRIVAGFYAGRTHSIIPMADCMLGQEINKDIIDRVLTYMEIHKVPPYDEETGKGLIRHILIRSGKFSGQIMVCIVANGNSLPYESDLVEHLKNVPGMTSIVLNVNKERTNVILGRKLRTLWGKDEIEDTLHVYDVTEDGAFVPAAEAVTFRISPLSFYQVNPGQTQKLYSLAMHYAGLTGKETVWDLYCGMNCLLLPADLSGPVLQVHYSSLPAVTDDVPLTEELSAFDCPLFDFFSFVLALGNLWNGFGSLLEILLFSASAIRSRSAGRTPHSLRNSFCFLLSV